LRIAATIDVNLTINQSVKVERWQQEYALVDRWRYSPEYLKRALIVRLQLRRSQLYHS